MSGRDVLRTRRMTTRLVHGAVGSEDTCELELDLEAGPGAADLVGAALRTMQQSDCRVAIAEDSIVRTLEGLQQLLFEAPPSEVDAVCALVREEMENVHPLDVPLVVDVGVGDSWGEAH